MKIINADKENSEGTVLIVDDQPLNLTVLFEYLNRSGYHILLAEDGETAIENARYSKPDLILLDIMMPGLDGFETCIILKKNEETSNIPIIFLTALSDVSDKVRAFEVGGVDYLIKPFYKEEVLARVSTHITLQRQKRELENSLAQVKTLKGLIPICAKCKNIRNDSGFWEMLEEYLEKHSMAEFSHGICPECAKILYPDLYQDVKKECEKHGIPY